MGAIYAQINPATGALVGGFYDNVLWPTLPANCVGPLAPTDFQTWASNPQGYTWNGAGLTATAAASTSPTGYSMIAQGLTITGSHIAVNATYPCDPLTMADIWAQVAYIQEYTVFPGSLSALNVADITGTKRPFTTTALFLEFARALQDYVTLCQQFDLGVSGVSLPSGSQGLA